MICPVYQKEEKSAGLVHQLGWISGLYYKCRQEGLIPVIPNSILSGGHNNGQEKLLIDYIDLPPEFVKSVPGDASEVTTYMWSGFPCIGKEIRTHFPFKEQFKAVAKIIVDKMPRPICSVRVRRTDMILVRPESDLTVQDINNVLSKYGYASLYLMTDEKNPRFFDGIERKYQSFDFPELANIKDNYALFAIECCIRDLCDIRIGMFTTHDDTEYFHGYLCNIFGVH